MMSQTSSRAVFKRILVAVDGSENSFSAAKVAINLARKHEAELIIVNALYTPAYWVSYSPAGIPPMYMTELREHEEKEANQLVAKIKDMASEEGLNAHTEIIKDVTSVVEAITIYALDQKADLIVIGTRGLSGFKKLLIGSVSSGVATHAPCSVLIVR
jgi:nucleotide-binding universal stress UspA family protein